LNSTQPSLGASGSAVYQEHTNLSVPFQYEQRHYSRCCWYWLSRDQGLLREQRAYYGRGDAAWPETSSGIPISVIQSPATKIMVTEGRNSGNNENLAESFDPDGFQRDGWAGHMGTWNCLYADGHVKAMRPVNIMTPVNQWGRFTGQTGPPDACQGNWTNLLDYVNCDKPDAAATTALQTLQQRHQ
jgi:prepilin-type processing-associated H-X9-DG protein